MGTALLFTTNSKVNGQLGLYIYEVTNQGSINAISNSTVGTPVTVIATINTENGTYNLYLGGKLVNSGTSEIHYIAANFTIPEIPGGDYNLTLNDITEGTNTTFDLPILTAYSITPLAPTSPAQPQEGSNVALNVTVTGGQVNAAYGAEITVVLPPPLNTNFTKTISLTTSSLGTAQSQVAFPDSSFLPSGSTTNYAGNYAAYFNRTQALAQQNFTVGFTDKTQYHKQDSVSINAVGYQPSQTATLAVEYNNGSISSQTVTASSQGIITTTYQVPSSAAVGTYRVTITPTTGSQKAIPDVQTFEIPGYPVVFTALNLAGEIVPGILIEAVDQAGSSTVFSNMTGFDGAAQINLEKGSVTIDAYWNQVKVGETQVSTTGIGSYNITCQLSDLKIKVQDKNGVVIPFVDLSVTFQYTNRTGANQVGNMLGQTDLTGTYTFNSTLPHVSYTVNASKYNTVFNVGNNTLANLAAQPNVQATIICPDETLTVKTVDYNNAVIPDAHITLIEQASGIFYSATTDSNGNAQLQVTFGQYRLSVYTLDNVLLNATVLNVVSNTQSQIRCVLSNLQITVKIVDYFGNPISNVNVQLSRPGMNTQSATTKNDGKATFNNVLGGNVEITAHPTGNENGYVAKNIQVNSPTTVTIAMEKYVSLGGALVETSLLATLLIIIFVIVLLVIIEVLRRTDYKLIHKRES
jgi:hypothetical protein